MKSELQLKRFFNQVNRKYYNLELPDVKIFFSPVSGDYGEIVKEGDLFVIRINPSEEGRPKSWRQAIYHETAHLRCWPYRHHGAKFQQEMLRLAQAGAFKDIW